MVGHFRQKVKRSLGPWRTGSFHTTVYNLGESDLNLRRKGEGVHSSS